MFLAQSSSRAVDPYLQTLVLRVSLSRLGGKHQQISEEIIEQQDLGVEPDLSYMEYPRKILDSKERRTRREKVKMYKI